LVADGQLRTEGKARAAWPLRELCRFCHRAQYLSQKQKTASRKRLSAAKLRLKLGGWPDIREPMPSKPKWTRRRTYQRIRNEIQILEAKANQTRFRKQIDIRTFAYHV
jgi:hypothetical protein